MKENQIPVIIKRPGKKPEVDPLFTNSLASFQEAVGGHIETVTFAIDACIICNEEGRLLGLEPNCNVLGVDFVGTIVVVGVKGDEFASLKAASMPMLLRMLGEE